jgi:protein SCO1/2
MTHGGWRAACASACIAGLGLAAFAAVTHGFTAVTSDGVRRAEIASRPRALPAIELVDSTGGHRPLRDSGRLSARATFVTLQYVRCRSVCLTSASGQSFLQAEIRARGLEDRLALLTLSFDPLNDTPQVLAQHARRLDADASLWRFATVADRRDLPRLLDFFGIVVRPDGLGGYAHNGALFLVDKAGRLVRAYDVDRPDLALAEYLGSADS